MAARYRR